MATLTDVALPSFDGSTVVVAAPEPGAGNWAGAPSAVLVDGVYWLAYRVRRPVHAGRGVAVDLARSRDGEHFEPVARVPRELCRARRAARRTGRVRGSARTSSWSRRGR